MHAKVKATEMITEIYVPRSALVSFMEEARRELREQKANLIYGTVRLIEKDEESFLCAAPLNPLCGIPRTHQRTSNARGSRGSPAAEIPASAPYHIQE